jgi:hypothetical protein
MKKILMAIIASVAGLFGLGDAKGAENPYYDPDSQISYPVSIVDRDAPDEVILTDTWNPDE